MCNGWLNAETRCRSRYIIIYRNVEILVSKGREGKVRGYVGRGRRIFYEEEIKMQIKRGPPIGHGVARDRCSDPRRAGREYIY